MGFSPNDYRICEYSRLGPGGSAGQSDANGSKKTLTSQFYQHQMGDGSRSQNYRINNLKLTNR